MVMNLYDAIVRVEVCGFVHLSCLAGSYAANKSKQTNSMNLGMIEFRKPWRVCPIATGFVSFV
jgi:hypothetical protein